MQLKTGPILWFGVAVLLFGMGRDLRAQGSGFGGPSILSRGMRPIGWGDGEPIKFRPFVSVRAGYYGSLSPLATDAVGTPVQDNSVFSQIGFGAMGSHRGPRDAAWGSYSGNYALFDQRSQSGVNQMVSLGYSRQLSRRWATWAGVGGMSQTTVLGVPLAAPASSLVDNPLVPEIEVVDSSVFGFGGQVGAGYQATARLTLSMSGGVSSRRRKAQSLASGEGYTASGEVNYMLSRRSGVGAQYSYSKYLYSRGFGGADSMTWMGSYRHQIDRSWSVGLGAGLYRMEAIRVQSFEVDPQIAALTGLRREVGRFYDKSSGLALQAALNGQFRRSSMSFVASRGQNPGNGFVLAGVQERVQVMGSHSNTDRMSMMASVGWFRQIPILAGLGGGLYRYQGYGPTLGVNYRIFSFVHVTVQAAVWKQTLETPRSVNPARSSISAGLVFSPGEVPLRVF